MLEKIISGGQTGVDRAALDVAIKYAIPHGGWCPKGRLSEEAFPIPSQYLLKETDSEDASVRTKYNIRDNDGTLIIVPTNPPAVTDGTILTLEEVKASDKPYFIIALSKGHDNGAILEWLITNNIKRLNVAGPRESQCLGIYDKSVALLKGLIEFMPSIFMFC